MLPHRPEILAKHSIFVESHKEKVEELGKELKLEEQRRKRKNGTNSGQYVLHATAGPM